MQQKYSQHIGQYSYSPIPIGIGNSSSVYQGMNLSGEAVAIKILGPDVTKNYAHRKLLNAEIQALQILKGPYLLQWLSTIEENDTCYIVTRLVKGHTLKEQLRLKGKLKEQEALRIFAKIVEGYCSVSNNHIVHRDLKPSNIMLNPKGDPTIIDFGFCQIVMTNRIISTYNVGSPAYMSPQAYQSMLYSEKSDVWSLGIILFQMLSGNTIEKGQNLNQYFSDLKSRKVAYYPRSLYSKVVCELLDQALSVSPQERASAHKLKYILDKHFIQRANYQQRQPLRTKKNLRGALLNHQQLFFKEKTTKLQAIQSNLNELQVNKPLHMLAEPLQKLKWPTDKINKVVPRLNNRPVSFTFSNRDQPSQKISANKKFQQGTKNPNKKSYGINSKYTLGKNFASSLKVKKNTQSFIGISVSHQLKFKEKQSSTKPRIISMRVI